MADIAGSTGGKGFYNSNGLKQAIAEVVNTTTHYYTVSYSPTNANWNGAFRKIKVDVAGYSVPSGFTWAKFFGADDDTKVEYRRGYYARTAPTGPNTPSARTLSAVNSAPGIVLGSNPGPNPNRRPLVSTSIPPRVHHQPTPMELAMAFGSATPTDIHFLVTVTPSATVAKPVKGAPPPNEVFLTQPFQSLPYRLAKIHYHIDPAAIHFQPTAKGTFADDIQFVAVLYRDDGLQANSISFTVHVEPDAATYAHLGSAPLAYDQTIAIPTTGVYFLRTGVNEIPTGDIGAIELPTESIH
jgi:hypothetical protein